ncbi:MAG TPA: hypothetical protein PK605_03675 [Ignavibacteria bacterium]|nr:hypothetical protein [Bacteroidota bacterium]HRE09178.1 hypothetical protein [Ignavibacteria bacterium]HRF66140.1 hypothetical protein [Ignavibacteria bacterium]HRJ03484.1 hypothetical protein [Ignavibacteria bacterium]HRJ84068.1 hypothetical protein [Ignavibacteria bacterium]
MKTVYISFFILFILPASGSLLSQGNNDSTASTEKTEWEMKEYYFVFLNAVKDRPKIDSAEAMKIQAGHLANIERMFNEGKCRLAGPFFDAGEMRGILILDVASEEEAKIELGMDPAINSGRLVPVIKKWYGPAGLIVEPKARK